MLATQLSSCIRRNKVIGYVHLHITEGQPKSVLCCASSKKQTEHRVYNQYMRESAFTVL